MKKSNVIIEIVNIENPQSHNFLIGQAHFIKTVADLHEAVVASVPGIKFGLAFCEASGPRLIRTSGTSSDMVKLAVANARKVGCGHVFFLFLDNAFPINVMSAVKSVPEVATIFCATSNPTQVIVGQTPQGAAVLGVVDGGPPQGVEKEADVVDRQNFLRRIGYKL